MGYVHQSLRQMTKRQLGLRALRRGWFANIQFSKRDVSKICKFAKKCLSHQGGPVFSPETEGMADERHSCRIA
jgi:hypothetical protein